MLETDKNLRTAFEGESMANRRYLFFAEKAEQEGYPQVARLFRAVAEAEAVHARNHLTVMGVEGCSIKDSLLAGAMAEHRGYTRVYPDFAEQAREEKNELAEADFDVAARVAMVYYRNYEKALEAVKKGQKLEDETYLVCQNCGNAVTGQAMDECPICAAPGSGFILIT